MQVYRKAGSPGFQRKLLCAAISMSLLPMAGTALAQDDATVEEVIVTGSFIRRTEGFRSASPLTQLTLEDIAAEGTPNMGDIIHNLSFNQGSSISSNITPGSGASETSINIRGLGAGATLDLVDGKRVIDGNVNQMLPQIAIQRLDIVVDGAAALYGSAAVAGVVNFVPIKSYDGFKFEIFNQQTDASDSYQEQMYSFLWGGDIGGLDVVLPFNGGITLTCCGWIGQTCTTPVSTFLLPVILASTLCHSVMRTACSPALQAVRATWVVATEQLRKTQPLEFAKTPTVWPPAPVPPVTWTSANGGN